MKKISLILAVILISVFVMSCENEDLENEILEIKSIDKDRVELPTDR